MKKFLMTMLAALVMTTAAEAQTTVQKMVIKKTDGTTAKVKLADIDEISFVEETATVTTPLTAEEAKQMLVGKWVIYNEEREDYDGILYEFRSIGTFIQAFRIGSGASDDADLKDYVGKFVLYQRGKYKVTPDAGNPANGVIELTYEDDESTTFEYLNLTSESFDVQEDGMTITFNRDDSVTYVEL